MQSDWQCIQGNQGGSLPPLGEQPSDTFCTDNDCPILCCYVCSISLNEKTPYRDTKTKREKFLKSHEGLSAKLAKLEQVGQGQVQHDLTLQTLQSAPFITPSGIVFSQRANLSKAYIRLPDFYIGGINSDSRINCMGPNKKTLPQAANFLLIKSNAMMKQSQRSRKYVLFPYLFPCPKYDIFGEKKISFTDIISLICNFMSKVA